MGVTVRVNWEIKTPSRSLLGNPFMSLVAPPTTAVHTDVSLVWLTPLVSLVAHHWPSV